MIRWTRELSAYVFSCVMTDPALLLCQSYVARRPSSKYWVLVLQSEIQLAYSWQSCIHSWHVLKVQVYRGLLGTYSHDCNCRIANPILHSTQSKRLLSSCIRIWNVGSPIYVKAAACALHVIVVRAYLSSGSQSIGEWDIAWVFMAKLHLSLLDMSWAITRPTIEFQAQLRSVIQSRMTCWDFYEVNIGKLRLIVNVSLVVRHASAATITLRSACSVVHCAVFNSACFTQIMFSFAWISGHCAHRLSSLKTLHIEIGK